MDEEAKSIVWTEEMSKERNCYVDASGRSSVNTAWRVEDYYAFFVPMKLEACHIR
jgi:hypothetical protein